MTKRICGVSWEPDEHSEREKVDVFFWQFCQDSWWQILQPTQSMTALNSLSFALQQGSRTVPCLCNVCVRRRRRPLRALTFRQCFQQTRLHIAALCGVRHVSWASAAESLFTVQGNWSVAECVWSTSCEPTAENGGNGHSSGTFACPLWWQKGVVAISVCRHGETVNWIHPSSSPCVFVLMWMQLNCQFVIVLTLDPLLSLFLQTACHWLQIVWPLWFCMRTLVTDTMQRHLLSLCCQPSQSSTA